MEKECARCTSTLCKNECIIYRLLGGSIAVNMVPYMWEGILEAMRHLSNNK